MSSPSRCGWCEEPINGDHFEVTVDGIRFLTCLLCMILLKRYRGAPDN
jgi:hypothetical protein